MSSIPRARGSSSTSSTGGHDFIKDSAADLGSHGLATDTPRPETLEHDVKAWQSWHKNELPKVLPKAAIRAESGAYPCLSQKYVDLTYTHLDHAFKVGNFAVVRLRADTSRDSVLLLHDIFCDENRGLAHFVVTRYSLLGSIPSLLGQNAPEHPEIRAKERELVMHYRDFQGMGTRDDAEIIRLEDIAFARDLHTYFHTPSKHVHHMLDSPRDLNTCDMFCRFATRSGSSDSELLITPLLPSRLDHEDQWRQRAFNHCPQPLVYDLTPNILGPSEGFNQASYAIHAGIGVDEEQNLTWKIRYGSAQEYDGSPLTILEELDSGKLAAAPVSLTETPRVALVAGANTYFRLSNAHGQMPSVEQFLHPLRVMNSAADSALRPDFVVAFMPAAVLHPQALRGLFTNIRKLLEKRFSVHLKLSTLQNHGIPQERHILIVVAAPLGIQLPWQTHWPTAGQDPVSQVRDRIKDLAFRNNRRVSGGIGGFVCSMPGPTVSGSSGGLADFSKMIYNHQTGRVIPPDANLVDVESHAISLSPSARLLGHPVRRDLLTVRELARLQGFDDDFVFYHSSSAQYDAVLNALPPIIARRVAKVIRGAIESSRKIMQDGSEESPRAQKRIKRESGESLSSY